MKTKYIFSIFGIILAIVLVSAVYYPEPFTSDVDVNDYDIYGADWISADTFNGTTAYFDNLNVSSGVTGPINWTNLQNYPVACPGSGAITTLGDSVTCSDLWFDITGNETITGNMTFSGSGILNLSDIESLDWTNITITESQINDLQSYLLNGTNVNLLDVNASSATIHGDLNMTSQNISAIDCIHFDSGGMICSGV